MDTKLIKKLFEDCRNWSDLKPLLRDHGINMGAQEAYDIIHDINDRIAPCGKEKQFKKFTLGYQLCGSTKTCECARNAALLKRTETNLLKFGATSPLAVPEIRKKRAETMVQRYSVEHPMQSETFNSKRKETNLIRYGVEHTLQSEALRKKGLVSLREKYGDDLGQIVEKRKETNLARYGEEIVARVPEFKEKTKQTNLDRYGVEHSSMLTTNRDKAKQTSIERYGKSHFTQRHYSGDAEILLGDFHKLEEALSKKSINGLAAELGISSTTILRRCHIHGIPVEKSTYEAEIADFLSLNNISYNMNNRSIIPPVEVDFYIPEARLAIEFNGIYWHSTARQPDIQYHRKKYLAARKNGVRLIMINEDEWLERSWTIKAKILNILGKSERGVGGRKLSLSVVSQRDANAFFDHHHIQGKTGVIQYGIGAFSNDQMVGCMAFNRQRGTNAVELIRFCSSGSTHAGMFSKMFKHAINENAYDEVISFADLRYSMGEVYFRNGFEMVKEISPDYRYVVRDRTYHKSTFTKTGIAKKFKIDMAGITEKEAMTSMGYHRIYDCGKLKFVWKK